ncbi:RNase A-like domain-containing protein [Streptomyces albus]|uniref:RNase A-like domain-containing protein n=1 Tax=Streptomyces albus TaxID=1888 RepID=UPI00131A6437|nr:RNase A-like domain-containing protein [Streptomyces albus]
MKPSHLYLTSALLRDGQFAHDKNATILVDTLDPYRQSAGAGSGADNFAAAYEKVATRFLEVWGKSVVSVGGTAVGLTETANNYAAAEWFSNARMHGPPPRRDPPWVIEKEPSYGPVSGLRWTGTGEDSDWEIAGILGEIPDFLADVIRPAIEHGLRLGRMHEITPGAKEDELKSVGAAWGAAGRAAEKAADGFAKTVGGITDGRNNEWQEAMNAFCQSIWGTTAWGQKRNEANEPVRDGDGRDWRTNKAVSPAQRRPVIEVLKKTAETVQKACDAVAAAIVTVRGITTELGKQAARATVKDLTVNLDFWELTRLGSTMAFGEIVMTFRSHMDTATANAAIDAYHASCDEAAELLRGCLPELDEAYLSAPTFNAEAARAQGFGARSLREFRTEHHYTIPDGDKENHFYAVDLANQEGIHNSHVIDKHVGKTDEQLAQRLRDQEGIAASSAFDNLAVAQRATQDAMDHIGPDAGDPSTQGEANRGVNNPEKIEKWLSRPRQDNSILPLDAVEFDYATGRTVTTDDPETAHARDTHSVKVVLKYKNGIDPPFVVYTSMPALP